MLTFWRLFWDVQLFYSSKFDDFRNEQVRKSLFFDLQKFNFIKRSYHMTLLKDFGLSQPFFGGFHLHLLVSPLVYQFHSTIEALKGDAIMADLFFKSSNLIFFYIIQISRRFQSTSIWKCVIFCIFVNFGDTEECLSN